MKAIQEITVWKDGTQVQSSVFKMYISYDDLETTATFQYQLLNSNLNTVAEGNLLIYGDDYLTWGNSGNPNEDAYNYGATRLNLTITGSYPPPIPSP